MWAPDRRPQGEWISATAVRPMAIPTIARRTNGSGTRPRIGRAGLSSSTVKTLADSMKLPSAQPSMKYSGQCPRHDASGPGDA